MATYGRDRWLFTTELGLQARSFFLQQKRPPTRAASFLVNADERMDRDMVRWGILGCGVIAARMATVLRAEPEAEIAAVAARDAARAQAFAEQTGAARAYGSYEALAADKEIDAVYVATIHPTHAALIDMCLRTGKAVLCEKPLTMSSQEAARLYALAEARGVPLMEAMWTRYLPAWRKARELADAGVIGELRSMDADFSGYIPYDPASRMYNPTLGGGCLWDLGVYCSHVILHMFGLEYEELQAMGRLTRDGVDSAARVTLRYPDGKMAGFTCACDQMGSGAARVFGTGGWLELPQLWDARQVTVHKPDGSVQTYDFPHADGFIYEVQRFHRLLGGEPILPGEPAPADTLTALRMLEEALAKLQ